MKFFTILILCLCAYGAYSATTKDRDSAALASADSKKDVDEQKPQQKQENDLVNSVLNKFDKFIFGNKKDNDEQPQSNDQKDQVEEPKQQQNSSRVRRQYGGMGGGMRGGMGGPGMGGPGGPGGMGTPYPARINGPIADGGFPDYPDFYDFYPNDFLYDYYEWVCSDSPAECQLCNVLTSECCDPDTNPNCVLPDSCLNNPCLSGGTCITTRTIDGNPDFICACNPGFTGKYCQLVNEFWFPPPPPPPPRPQPQPNYGGYGQQQGYGGYGQQQQGYGYGQQAQYGQGPQQYGPPQPQYGQQPQYGPRPQPSYGQPQQQYGQPQPSYGQPQQQYGQPQPSYGQQPSYQQPQPQPSSYNAPSKPAAPYGAPSN